MTSRASRTAPAPGWSGAVVVQCGVPAALAAWVERCAGELGLETRVAEPRVREMKRASVVLLGPGVTLARMARVCATLGRLSAVGVVCVLPGVPAGAVERRLLRAGADDVVGEDSETLRARLTAALRRTGRGSPGSGTRLVAPGRLASLGLTASEQRLLDALLAAGGGLVTADQVLATVLRARTGPDNVRRYFWNLSRKLRDAGVEGALVTVRGLGWRLHWPESEPTAGSALSRPPSASRRRRNGSGGRPSRTEKLTKNSQSPSRRLATIRGERRKR